MDKISTSVNIAPTEHITKLTRALKYYRKILKQIDRNGSAVVKINCTGAEFVIDKGTIFETYFQHLAAKTAYELKSYSIVRNEVEQPQ